MAKPLDELYLTWLYRQIDEVRLRHSSKTYWGLLKLLYTKEFVYLVSKDENRVEDGKELRYRFLDEEGIEDVDPNWMHLPCSMLEMMIGLAGLLSFEADRTPHSWFWEMIQNLGLDGYNDRKHIPVREVDDILDRVIWRNYDRDGHGGLFPLRHSERDQRRIELWYQMSAYLIEREIA